MGTIDSLNIESDLLAARAEVERLEALKAQERKRLAEERRRLEAARRAEHAEEMAATYLPGLPEAVTDKVYEYAYQQGHSAGYPDIESYYADLVEVIEIAYNAGYNEARDQRPTA
jgi:hypothetical protein